MPINIRPIRIDGNIAYVTLTKGYEAIIDAEDIVKVQSFNWTALVKARANGKFQSVYAFRTERFNGGRRPVYMHRTIAETPTGMDTDHADGDGLNNTKANLRSATRAENGRNQKISVANTSGFKGVTWHGRDRCWMAQIHMNGRNHFLGYHKTAEDAHRAYASASAELHGAFGRSA